MPVTAVTTDADALTMTLVADFTAPVSRLWWAFTEPRRLERFWGPPGWPATFTVFDLRVGGRAEYHMTSPTGDLSRGGWEFLRIDEPNGFEVVDSFLGEDGKPIEGMPSMRMTFAFEATGQGSRMTNVTFFTSPDALEQVVAMGAVEGSTLAMSQLDHVLEGLRAYAQGKGTRTEILDDTHVRITRLIEGPRELVWQAHHEPGLLRQWLLGPEGWRMTVCEVDANVGGRYRYAWEPDESTSGQPFGFDGETLFSDPPRRAVTTEHMTGTDLPSTTNDLSLFEEDGATLITLLIAYPDKTTRDLVLGTGMTDGMETSYARLDGLLAR
ncbi:SRPBCC family protein [Propionicicella superfundia]|uniref:SRPBCC family protein n=1 Tax=Propionicicella superfundia TaxID=348582 RepID=UPI0003F7A5B3|nr:SRPBCC family protein [Propionicicella superfundia]